MLPTLVRRSLRGQWVRFSTATLVVVLGTTMVSALANLSFDVGRHTGRELRAYGSNVLIFPRGGALAGVTDTGGLVQAELVVLDELPDVLGYTPALHVVGSVQDQPAIVTGVVFDRVRGLDNWWWVEGGWPRDADEALLGVNLAQALGLAPGDQAVVRVGTSERTVRLVGLLEVGGAEDGQLLLPLPSVQALASRPGQVDVVEVSVLASGQALADTLDQLRARLPRADVRLLRQFAQADEEVLAKVRLLVALVALLTLAYATMAVAASTLTTVLERRAEIGLFKALGAREWQVATLFLAEGLSVGALGGLAGYLAGLGLAALVGQQVFQAALRPNPLGLPLSLGVAVGVVLLASAWPVRQALAVDPAVTLRGE